MKIKIFFYILLACYTATFLRLFIDNNFIISIVGSFFVGFIINKRLSYSSKQILLIKKPTKNDPIIEIIKLLLINNLKNVPK